MTARPRYETEADLEHEERVRRWLENRYNVTILKLSEALWSVDWCAGERVTERPNSQAPTGMSHRINWFGEYKRRAIASTDFDHYMLSAAKWEKLRAHSKTYGVPAYLFVEFTDGLFVSKHHKALAGFGGRHDRSDAFDVEPAVFISLSNFKRISK